MDNRNPVSRPSPIRHHSPSSSLNSLRAFTGPPLRPAQPPVSMMQQSPHVRTGSHPIADVKPRLTKEQHDILENHFLQQQKPTTNTKKGFAESLGVPLDKINNWFQNRRAKVKQDAKKAQNQQMMYQANFQSYSMPQQQQASSQHQPQQMSIPTASSFYASNSSVSPASRSTDSPQPSHEGLSAQFNLQQPDYNAQGLTSINETSHQSSFNVVLQSMIAAGYNMEAGGALPQPSQFDGFESSSFGSNMSGHNQFLSSLTIPSTNGFGDSLDFSTFTPGSTTMQPADSLGSASSDPISFSGHQFTPATQSCSSAHATGSVASLPIYNDDDSDAQEEFFDPGFAFQAHGLPRHGASSSQISLPIYSGPNFSNSGMYQQSNHSSQVIISTPDQYDAFGDLEPPNPPFAQGAFCRRSSSTSNLAESMMTVGIDSRGSSECGSFKQSSQPSSIAARRHRRPAPLGASTTRSASYTPGMPGSPSANSQGSNAEQNLRRIRSSQGMGNGRIQKPSSAQHSPITFAFNAAASSPKFARAAAGIASGVSTPGGNGSLAPLTPLTPNEGGRFPSWQSSGEIKPQPSFGDSSTSPPDSLGIVYSTESSSDQPDANGGTPATSPDANPQNQASRASSTMYRDTPPQSAPATQQQFSHGMYMSQSQSVNDFLAPNDYAFEHMRRPSLPEAAANLTLANQMHQFPVPNFNSSGELQLGYQVPYSSNMNNGYAHPGMSMYSMDSAPSVSSAAGASQSTAPNSDFLVVHEYAPPHAQGQKAEPRRQQEQPKTFVFANAGPNDFQQNS